jgi:hypothetical protein
VVAVPSGLSFTQLTIIIVSYGKFASA